jgi:hypothetical protein
MYWNIEVFGCPEATVIGYHYQLAVPQVLELEDTARGRQNGNEMRR